MNEQEQIILLKELQKRYLDELEFPTGYIHGNYPDSHLDYQATNKAKLKRLRLLIAEVMKELEE